MVSHQTFANDAQRQCGNCAGIESQEGSGIQCLNCDRELNRSRCEWLSVGKPPLAPSDLERIFKER